MTANSSGSLIKRLFEHISQRFPAVLSLGSKIAFPPLCVICEMYCDCNICPECSKLVHRPDADNNDLSGLFDYGKVHFFAKYSGVIKELVGRYKFKGQMWLGKRIGNILYEQFKNEISGYDYLVYVPVSITSFKKRGFDQCFEIASEISKRSGVPIVQALESNSGKRRQSKLKRGLRKDNATGRFGVRDDYFSGKLRSLKGRRILLVDDILTTGSTLRECAGLLIEFCGCQSVDAMVFATGRVDV